MTSSTLMRVILATLAIGLALGSRSAGATAVNKTCGYGETIRSGGHKFKLTYIDKRRGVSCRKAKRIFTAYDNRQRKAGRGGGFCWYGLFRGWRVRPLNYPGLHVRFIKGDRRFEVKSQGSC